MKKILDVLGIGVAGGSIGTAAVVYMKNKKDKKSIAISVLLVVIGVIIAKLVADDTLLPEGKDEVEEN